MAEVEKPQTDCECLQLDSQKSNIRQCLYRVTSKSNSNSFLHMEIGVFLFFLFAKIH